MFSLGSLMRLLEEKGGKKEAVWGERLGRSLYGF